MTTNSDPHSCLVERRILTTEHSLDLRAGELHEKSKYWRTTVCGKPLFSETRAYGVCKSCLDGWTHEHSYATAKGKRRIEAAQRNLKADAAHRRQLGNKLYPDPQAFELGEKLHEVIVEHYLETGKDAKREDIAKRLGVSESTVGKWLRSLDQFVPGVHYKEQNRSLRTKDRWKPALGTLRELVLQLRREAEEERTLVQPTKPTSVCSECGTEATRRVDDVPLCDAH